MNSIVKKMTAKRKIVTDWRLAPGTFTSRPTPTQWKAICEHVAKFDFCVDLGAGPGHIAEALARLGNKVIAYDRYGAPKGASPVVEWHKMPYVSLLNRVLLEPDVFNNSCAYLGYPSVSGISGLVHVLGYFESVIYLGDTFDGTSCGDASLWDHLRCREVLGHVAHQRGQLIIYGRPSIAYTLLLPEEVAGLDTAKTHRSPYDPDPEYVANPEGVKDPEYDSEPDDCW